ncbi:MAG: tetratricopeptide repeat protein, partial [Myxococcales bacterium]|nr:tetratricopeptide repeat protein [Myxococcales bacterium]
DQFAFCVALFEAVYGARPFAADTLAEHLSCITRGAIATPRADRRVPAWLRRALLRGLAAHPRDRWPSMNALLSELTRDRARTRRRLIGAALVVSSLVVGAAGFARSYGDEADACERVADLGGVWDPPRAQVIHDALTRTGAAYAEDAWRQVQAQLDAHATRWSATRVEACASHLRGAQSDTLYDRRVACLDRRREELAAVTNVLAEADATVVENAGRLAFGLVPVATCDDLERLSAAVLTPEEPQLAARVDALRSRLTRVSAERGAGRYRAALAEARAITDEAEALGYRPLVAEARLELGLLEGHLDHFAGADESLSQALWDAEATGHDEVAVTASQQRILLYGDRMAEYARAHAWLPHAQAIADRVADDRTFAQLAFVRGAVLLDEGRLQEARAELTRAVPLVRQSFGDEHPMTARALRSLASTLNSLGEFDEARGHLEAAVAILERSLGPRHPTLAQVLLTLGNLHIGQGRDDEALAAYGRALEISRAALGDDHVSTGAMTLSVGLVHGQRRELEEADQKFTRALEIFEARLGPEHPNVAVALANLGSTKAAQGQLDAALEHLQRGAAILERVNGDDHKDTSAMRAMLGDVLRRKGDLAGAQALYQRAIATLERTLGPDHHELAIPLAGLARCALDDDRPRQALPLARRALALREANHEEGHDLAADQLLLARCLWDGGGDKAEARALAEAARRALEAAGPRFEAERDEVASWLEGHP